MEITLLAGVLLLSIVGSFILRKSSLYLEKLVAIKNKYKSSLFIIYLYAIGLIMA